jgi:hypothetical protein
MTANRTILPFAIMALCAPAVFGQAALFPNQKLRGVFPGTNQFTLLWTNKGAERIDLDLIGKVFQTGGNIAIVLPIEIKTKLQLFPNQTALVPASLVAPDVRGKTKLLIQWQAASEVIGNTEVVVFPRDLLHELELLAGETPIAVVTSDETIKNAFKVAKAKFDALEKADAADYKGKLMIVKDASLSIEALRKTLAPVATRGAVVVCIIPSSDDTTPLRPTFFATEYGRSVMVFVQEQFVENFDINPESQSRLVEICKLAIKPDRRGLPMISKD